MIRVEATLLNPGCFRKCTGFVYLLVQPPFWNTLVTRITLSVMRPLTHRLQMLDDGKMAGVHPVYVAPHDQDWFSDRQAEWHPSKISCSWQPQAILVDITRRCISMACQTVPTPPMARRPACRRSDASVEQLPQSNRCEQAAARVRALFDVPWTFRTQLKKASGQTGGRRIRRSLQASLPVRY